MRQLLLVLGCLLGLVSTAKAASYPDEWWKPVPKEGAPDWEVLPQEADRSKNEVILSKRNELGILSNFAATPFVYRGKTYASLEGFWQATKFPENGQDPRMLAPAKWTKTRAEVEQLTAFDAKHAGDGGSANMKLLKIDWVSFEGKRLVYKESGESAFYQLIREAMWQKLQQNSEVRRILLATGDLKLRPDHAPSPPELKAWAFYDIWMEFRRELQNAR